ncbi:MAG: hypothetical protein J6R85_04100, partial [Lentisphaeria bacterium]|nr:hypothetical protein [Lentisphaeria bacterium]
KQPLSYNMTRTDPARLTPDLHLQLSDFRLGLLHFLLPAHQDLQLDGTVSGQITAGAGATPGAAQLKVDLRGDALAFQCAGWNLKDAGGLWQGAIALDEKRERLQCPAMTVQISSHGESLIRGDFSGTWDLSGKEAEILAALGQADEDLLASFPGEIAGFIRKLPLLPEHFQLSADGKLLFRENLFRIEHCRATATGENNAQFTVLLDHQDFRGGDARDRWKFRLAAGAPADLLTPYLPHGVRIYSGNATLDAHADAAPDFQTMTLESDLQLQDWSGAFWEHDFTDGGMQLHTNLYMPSPQRVLINNSDLYFLHYGRPALRAGLSGSANYDGTAMQLAFDLRYLNEQFLNLLLPGRFRTGLLTGKIAASGDLRGTLHTTGMLILDKFTARSATLPSSGFLRFEATQNAAESRLDTVELQLMQAGKTLAKAALRAHCPAAPDAPAQIDVTVEHADLSTLYSGVANTVPQPETELPEERSSRKPFFFGKRPICVGLDLQNLHWGKSARFDLTGDLFFRENNFRTVNSSLRVNGKPIHFSLDLEDTPDGMLLRTRGNVPETLDLASVASIWDSAQIGGNLIRGQWDLFWQNLLQSGGDPEARGHLQADFQDLRVETGGEDPWVRLFLLPVEALVRLRSVLPSSLNLRDQWKSILQSAVDPDSPLAELKFHRGKLHLELDGRKIRIRQADFNGSTIHDLSFTGGIGIAKPFALDLKTAIRAGVLRGALPIRGTLADPDAEISELLTSLTGLNMDQFPDFSPGSWKTLPEKATSTFTRCLQDMSGLAPGQ